MPTFARWLFLALSTPSLLAQAANPNTALPKVKTPAPTLAFTQVLQAPFGAKVDWPSLRGKVVVLEFWATWCAPCIGEIPVLNELAAAVDPAKVQVISVDDEAPAVVRAFLKKKPISAWVGIDVSGKIFDRYGVAARPATVVVGPDGRILSTSIRPEQLNAKRLMAIADGSKVSPEAPVSASKQKQLDSDTAKAWQQKAGTATAAQDSMSGISVTASDPGSGEDTHVMSREQGQLDITNATLTEMLPNALGVPKSRIHLNGDLPQVRYNLHVNMPGADPKQLAIGIELAIASALHVHIEHSSSVQDAYVLASVSETHPRMQVSPYPGMAAYSHKKELLQCINASPQQIAVALESALDTPVIDETGIAGKFMENVKLVPKDLASANAAVAEFGMVLRPEKRSVETLTVSPAGS